MLNIRTLALATLVLAMGVQARAAGKNAPEEKAKYYFKISNIESEDKKVIPMAREILAKEVSGRPELTLDLGDAKDESATVAELAKRNMKGFMVSLRIMSLKKTIKPPAPGKRDQQMSIDVKLGIFGNTIPGNKLLFTGDGDASLTGEFSERLKDKEDERFTQAALASAIKQAVATAVAKLTTTTMDDKKPGKSKKGKSKP